MLTLDSQRNDYKARYYPEDFRPLCQDSLDFEKSYRNPQDNKILSIMQRVFSLAVGALQRDSSSKSRWPRPIG
jgi:hypothetical protein